MDIEKILQSKIKRENILKDEPMSKHTSFKIGGNADYFIKVENVKELKSAIEIAKKYNIPYFIVGNGTNLLVRDKGVEGFVIKPCFNSFKVKKTKDGAFIFADSGLSVSSLSRIAEKEELTGVEFLAGIPGTVGGAVYMNAGAYGSEMKDVVCKTKYLDEDGKIKVFKDEEHKFEYRKSVFLNLNCVIVETVIKVKKGNKEEIKSKIEEFMNSRKEKQPLEYPNAGSIFKRKENVITAKLIDEAGLKGYSIGDAEISTKHAGFIVNKGKATAKDVTDLIDFIKSKVKEKFNEDIDLEIFVIGRE